MSVNNGFKSECIRGVMKKYGGENELPLEAKIMQEINNAYDFMSGCQFMEYINHKLFAYLMEKGYEPTYCHWEEIDCDSDTEEEEEEEDQDNFENKMCEYCSKSFLLSEPHYNDEEEDLNYCSEECYKKEKEEQLPSLDDAISYEEYENE